MHSGVYFRTQLNYPTTVGLFEARFEALSEEAFRLVLLSEWCSLLGTGPHTLSMERRFFPTQDGVDISYSWPRESSVCCLWLVLPPGVGCVCVCVCARACSHLLITVLEDGGHDGALVVVSRLRSPEPVPGRFLFLCSSLGMCTAPASGLPGPPFHPRKTRGLRLLVTHGRKLCRQ